MQLVLLLYQLPATLVRSNIRSVIPSASEKRVPYRPGDKRQLKAQDVTAKLVRFDILHMVPKKKLLLY